MRLELNFVSDDNLRIRARIDLVNGLERSYDGAVQLARIISHELNELLRVPINSYGKNIADPNYDAFHFFLEDVRAKFA